MIRKMFHRLRADERGSAGIIYALAAIPVLMLAGGTVDYTIALNERARLQGALDAAALAAMRRRDLEADEIDSLVRDYVMSHFAGNGRTTLNRSDISVSVEKISGYWQVSATARATVRTPFWGILGRTSASVKARADVKDSVSALDVVLVLDNTGSMDGNKLWQLQEASKNLIRTLHDKAVAGSVVRVGLVPFNHYVNIGTEYCGRSWLSANCEAPDVDNMPLADLLALLRRSRSLPATLDALLGDLVDYVAADNDPGPFDSCDSGGGWGWGWGWNWSARPARGAGGGNGGSRRSGGQKFSARGGKSSGWPFGWGWWDPDPGDDDDDDGSEAWCDLTDKLIEEGLIRRWERYDVAIDEDFVRGILIDLLPPDYAEDWAGVVGIRDDDLDLVDDSYDEAPVPAITSQVYESGSLVERDAPHEIVPLGDITDDSFHAELGEEIDAMEASGWTYIPIGLAWGWRALSEKEPLAESAESNGTGVTRTHKVIVLLTDGENTCIPANDGEGRVSCSNAWGYATEADERTRKLCHNIRDEGIDIITVAFDVDTQNVKDLLETCSSRGFYDAGASQLSEVFDDIATKLVRMHLSR